MEDELKKFQQFNAHEIVPDEYQNNVSDGGWVINKKDSHDGLKVSVKTRFWARGFKEAENLDQTTPM